MATIIKLDLQEPETASDLWRLQHAAYRIEADLIGVAGLPPLQDTIASLQASEETFWGCRLTDGELVGVLAAEWEKDGTAVVSRMMVHPQHFRQGIASRLVAFVLEAWPQAARWEVTAQERNLPAIALYGRFGFCPVETFYPRADIAMIRMIRESTKT